MLYQDIYMCTVEPVLKDRPIDHKNMVSQDRWSLVTGSFTLKCVTCQTRVVLQDRWSLMLVVSQDRFDCTSLEARRLDHPRIKYLLFEMAWNFTSKFKIEHNLKDSSAMYR